MVLNQHQVFLFGDWLGELIVCNDLYPVFLLLKDVVGSKGRGGGQGPAVHLNVADTPDKVMGLDLTRVHQENLNRPETSKGHVLTGNI